MEQKHNVETRDKVLINGTEYQKQKDGSYKQVFCGLPCGTSISAAQVGAWVEGIYGDKGSEQQL